MCWIEAWLRHIDECMRSGEIRLNVDKKNLKEEENNWQKKSRCSL